MKHIEKVKIETCEPSHNQEEFNQIREARDIINDLSPYFRKMGKVQRKLERIYFKEFLGERTPKIVSLVFAVFASLAVIAIATFVLGEGFLTNIAVDPIKFIIFILIAYTMYGILNCVSNLFEQINKRINSYRCNSLECKFSKLEDFVNQTIQSHKESFEGIPKKMRNPVALDLLLELIQAENVHSIEDAVNIADRILFDPFVIKL